MIWNEFILLYICLECFGFILLRFLFFAFLIQCNVIAYPYYVPPGVFALRYGGKTDAGTVTAVIDLFGFAAVAPFSYLGAALSEEKNGWGYVWLFMYMPVLVLVVFLYAAFNTHNLKSEKKQELLMKRIEAEIDTLTKGFIEHQSNASSRGSLVEMPPNGKTSEAN